MTAATHRFIGGSGRSGTSVLIESLGCHPQVFPFWEPKFLCMPGGVHSYLEGGNANVFRANMAGKYLQKINAIFKGKDFSYRISRSQMKLMLADVFAHPSNRHQGIKLLVDGIFAHVTKATKMPIVIEKTPHTCRMTTHLHKMFGDGLRYIHIVRDPRAVYLSQKRLGWVQHTRHFVPRYLEVMTRALMEAFLIPARNHCVVSLEEIMEDPDSWIKNIHEFMELPAADKITHKFKTKQANLKPSGFTTAECREVWSYCQTTYDALKKNFGLKSSRRLSKVGTSTKTQ